MAAEGLAIDWGSNRVRLRSFTHEEDGPRCYAEYELALPLDQARASGFDHWLEQLIDRFKLQPHAPIVASGMITSRGGWRETEYLDCPVDLGRLASSLVHHTSASGRRISLVPGIRCPAAGFQGFDVIRGEESQVLGALTLAQTQQRTSLWLLPGTHAKWILCKDATVQSFCTFVTGELFGLIHDHASFGERPKSRTVAETGEAPPPTPDFERGFRAALDDARRGPEFLLHGLFATRCLALADQENQAFRRGYSSGLMIATEIHAARKLHGKVTQIELLGDSHLSPLYTWALKDIGLKVRSHNPDAHMHGIAQLIKLCPTF